MTSFEMPNYIRNYCRGLDDLGWMIYHSKMIVPLEIVKEEEDLIYLLKWILKEDPDNFTYSVYVHHMMGIGEGENYIDDTYRDMLDARYYEQFLKDFAPEECFESWLEENRDNFCWSEENNGNY